MKSTLRFLTVLPILLGLLVAGCTLDAPESPMGLEAPEGTEVFSSYVAIGNSLTAGFMDGGLIVNGQVHSYPRLLAQKLGLDASIGNSQFSQPYIKFPGIGSSASSDPETMVAGVLHFDGSGVSVVDETPRAAIQSLLLTATVATPFNNLGVPGATLHDAMNAYDEYTSTPAGNSFFNFINRESLFGNVSMPATAVSPAYESASMFGQAVAKGPTLMTVWLGNNDVLGAATYCDPGTRDDPESGTVPPTDLATFTAEYTALLQMLAGGLIQRTGFPATIVTASIPSITSVPYFIPRAMFDAMVPWPWGYEEEDAVYVAFPTVSWAQAVDGDGAPLFAGQQIPAHKTDTNFGAGTLTQGEVDRIADAVANFNGVIAQVTAGVNASGYAMCDMVDANSLLAGVTANYGPYASSHFMALLLNGMSVKEAAGATLFSLDGIHPNNRGYGVVANAFIDKISEMTGLDIEHAALYPWDPTYEQLTPGKSATDAPMISLEAAAAMSAVFR